MKVIIAGSREGVTLQNVLDAATEFEAQAGPITEVVSGRAMGADQLGEKYAKLRNLPVHPVPANWKPDGPGGPVDRAAGHKRNRAMADYAEGLVAIWDGRSPGTKGMIDAATKKGLPIIVCYFKREPKDQMVYFPKP